MKQLNTLPIEDFLEKARIAIKSNQKNIVLPIKDVIDLQNSLSVVMTRLAGELDEIANSKQEETIVINMDGGTF
jgi:hypothetical protein